MKATDEYIITVRNEQSANDMCDTVTETGKGTFRSKDGICYLTYRTDSTKVLIRASEDEVRIKRTGDAASEITYRPGRRSYFEYKTAYGTFAMSVFTAFVRTDAKEGTIRLGYTLETNGDEINNEVTITTRGINKWQKN
ncbi:MAG: DUF1934 domain-containing protein [Clostridia bacterium]|nr:DUF1934 domain-containing protein [Clostridia bacterium]